MKLCFMPMGIIYHYGPAVLAFNYQLAAAFGFDGGIVMPRVAAECGAPLERPSLREKSSKKPLCQSSCVRTSITILILLWQCR
jgi:hypothetical protein